jgi:integrase
MPEDRGWRCKEVKVMSQDALLKRIEGIKGWFLPRIIRDRALIITLYLTAARAGEVVRHGFLGVGKDGITKEDITTVTRGGRKFRIFTIRNLKNEQRKIKELPVSEDDPINNKMLQHLDLYTENLLKDEPLFPISVKRTRQIVKRHLGKELSPHYLRHMRLTHLARDKDFNEWELATFAGWSGPGPARHYVHDDPKKLFSKL